MMKNLDLMPANIDLVGAEVELVSMMARETSLKRALEEVKGLYDYIFMDCPAVAWADHAQRAYRSR